MRKVYRHEDNAEYWNRRWSEAGRDGERFTDLSIYPIHYAEMVMHRPDNTRTLEIGCGLGRVLKHYALQGYTVAGVERSAVAVRRLNEETPELQVQEADVLALPFADGEFDTVLAFGVYHNLENGLEEALRETARCLRAGGRFCISMRPDNLEMRLNELYWRQRQHRQGKPRFHKLLVREREFAALLAACGLETVGVHYARNVSLLYRVPFLRSGSQELAPESVRRSEGYRLNSVGRTFDRALTRLFPYQTSNVLVYVGGKRR